MDLERLKIDRSRRSPRRRGRGKALRWTITLAVIGAFVWFLRLPLGRLYDRVALPAVEVARAARTNPLAATAVVGTAANGYIVASRRAALSADTPGRIVEMNVEEGSVVSKGDVVARLYAKEYEAALRMAEAELDSARSSVQTAAAELAAAKSNVAALRHNVAAAQARLTDQNSLVALAKLDYDRAQDLFDRGAGTQQELDEARTQHERSKATLTALKATVTFAESAVVEGESRVEVADAALAQARTRIKVNEAQRDQAQATLDKTEVRAPFDGVVVLKDAEVGEVVSPNAQGAQSRGSVVTMVDFASLEVQVDMPETSLSAVKQDGPANIYLDAFPRERYLGTVTRIWPTANRQKGSVEIRVRFNEPDNRLRPEMGVRVVFRPEGDEPATDAGDEAEVVLVPQECVVRVDGRPGVFMLERDTVRWREVKLGEQRGGRVVVTAGLKGGESLVANPPPDLADGGRVRIAQ